MISFYSCEVQKVGLPAMPKNSFNNWFDILDYINSLEENDQAKFLELWHNSIYQHGIATGEQNILDDLEDN